MSRSHSLPILLAAFLIAACSGSGGSSTDSPSVDSSPPPPPPPPESSGLSIAVDADESGILSVVAGELSDHLIFVEKDDPSISATLEVQPAIAGADILDENGSSYLSINAGVLPVGMTTVTIEATNNANGLTESATVDIEVVELSLVASSRLGSSGGVVASPGGLVGVRFDDGELSQLTGIEIHGATTMNGDVLMRVVFDRDISNADARMSFVTNTSATSLDESASSAFLAKSDLIVASTPTYTELVQKFSGFYFADSFRIAPGAKRLSALTLTCSALARAASVSSGSTLCIKFRPDAAVLSGPMSAGEIANLGPDVEIVPVLFIHGYEKFNWLGGGDKTWNEFQDRVRTLSSADKVYIPFEFQWRTNASFRVVADDLNNAMAKIGRLTGRPTRIIAHSFGGLLARTLIQDQARSAVFDRDSVRSLLTLGTPHSGIYEDGGTGSKFNDTFPDGQDQFAFAVCLQVSCYQAGEDALVVSGALAELTDAGELGGVVQDLVKAGPPKDLPTVVGIGLKREDGDNDIYDSGDGLITYEGQRIETGSTYLSLPEPRKCTDKPGIYVAEAILGGNGKDLRPNSKVDNNAKGYAHSSPWLSLKAAPDSELEYSEAHVNPFEEHDSFNFFLKMLDANDPDFGACIPPNYVAPDLAPTLVGTTVSLTIYSPDLDSQVTIPHSAIVRESLEFPFGVTQLAGTFNNNRVIRSDRDFGDDYLEIVYIDSGFASSGTFNGLVFEFLGEDSPTIVDAFLDPTQNSNFTAEEARITSEPKKLLVNLEGVRISSGDRLYVRLILANP